METYYYSETLEDERCVVIDGVSSLCLSKWFMHISVGRGSSLRSRHLCTSVS